MLAALISMSVKPHTIHERWLGPKALQLLQVVVCVSHATPSVRSPTADMGVQLLVLALAVSTGVLVATNAAASSEHYTDKW